LSERWSQALQQFPQGHRPRSRWRQAQSTRPGSPSGRPPRWRRGTSQWYACDLLTIVLNDTPKTRGECPLDSVQSILVGANTVARTRSKTILPTVTTVRKAYQNLSRRISWGLAASSASCRARLRVSSASLPTSPRRRERRPAKAAPKEYLTDIL